MFEDNKKLQGYIAWVLKNENFGFIKCVDKGQITTMKGLEN